MPQYILVEKNVSSKLHEMAHYMTSHNGFMPINSLFDKKFKTSDLIVFAVDVDELAENAFFSSQIKEALHSDLNFFKGLKGAFLVSANTSFSTKRFAQRMIFMLNCRGMNFEGHSVIEATVDYENYKTWQKTYMLPLKEVCLKRIDVFCQTNVQPKKLKRNNLLVLHASKQATSNTLMLWQMVEKSISGFNINKSHIENGSIVDCKGCSYKACLHYAENNSCFYGGKVTKEILPAIAWADIIVWACPNYNDAVSAMHTALINRLTVLYRRMSFAKKQIYGIVVSGNSGGDSVACQLIGALNINKGFALPAYAFLCETANDPGSILKVDGITERANRFANVIMRNAQ